MSDWMLKLKRAILGERLSGVRLKLRLILILSVIFALAVTGIIANGAAVTIIGRQAAAVAFQNLQAVAGNMNRLAGNMEAVTFQIATDPELAKLLDSLNSSNPQVTEWESLPGLINRRLKPWLASNPEIEKIIIVGAPGRTINFSRRHARWDDSADFTKISGASWYRKAISLDGRPLWVMSHPGLGSGANLSCIRLIKAINMGHNFLLITDLDSRALRRILSRPLYGGGGQIYLTGPGETYFSSHPPATDSSSKRFNQPLNIPGWFLLGTLSKKEATGFLWITKPGYIIIIILLAGLSIWGSLWFSKYWAKPLPVLREAFQTIASGKLVPPIAVRREDEIGLLVKAYNRMLDKYRRIMADIDRITLELNSLTGQITGISREVTEGSVSISGTLAELTEVTAGEAAEVNSCLSNIGLLTESIRMVNNYAALIQQMKTEILALTAEGRAALENLELRSHETKTITIEINRLIYNLNEQTQEIQDIVTRIREIVVQTDMISLNATIEATRIKEIKKEVLALAYDVKKHVDYSAVATRNITEVIMRIENKTGQATAMAEIANEAVESQTGIIRQCAQVFNDIRLAANQLVEKFEAVIDLMAKVETDKNEIMGLTAKISDATAQIAAMTEKLSVSFQKEQTAMTILEAGAGELEGYSTELRTGFTRILEHSREMY